MSHLTNNFLKNLNFPIAESFLNIADFNSKYKNETCLIIGLLSLKVLLFIKNVKKIYRVVNILN